MKDMAHTGLEIPFHFLGRTVYSNIFIGRAWKQISLLLLCNLPYIVLTFSLLNNVMKYYLFIPVTLFCISPHSTCIQVFLCCLSKTLNPKPSHWALLRRSPVPQRGGPAALGEENNIWNEATFGNFWFWFAFQGYSLHKRPRS